MVLCKFFQQGNCRFGQYCKFEHSYGNRSKTFGDEKNIVLIVAEEVLAAERGGQWLLSCFGPFKERKCLPGMEDFSPEEVRWEMYQAQKNGTTDQINTQFQQMCEAMKVKREALKHPTPAIQQLLEEVQNSGSDHSSAFVDKNKANPAFGQSQMSLANNTQSSNVFTQKSAFGAAPNNNPFGGSSTFNASQPASSIFGQSNNVTTNSVFGGKPAFGGSSVFGGSSSTSSSMFGGANKTAISPFGSVPNTQTFGGLATQGTNASIFGGASSTTAFGQPPAFGSQTNNAFLKPSTSQTSVFGGAPTTGNVFGGSVTSTAPTNSAFSSAATAGAGNSSLIFGQKPANTSAFGGAPVFGGSAFGSTQNTGSSVFGGQTTFGSAVQSNNIFGSANAQTSTFGAIAQNAATSSAFGAAPAPTTGNAFEAAPNATPFGTSSSITAGPFGTASSPAAQVFATGASTAPVFGNTFSSGSTFGTQQAPATNSTTNVFGVTTATSNTQSVFGGTAAVSNTPSAFGGTASASNTQSVFSTNAFGNTQTTVFGSTATASGNPFMKASPFGIAEATQASPFGAFAKSNVGFAVTVTIDETGYTPDENLTDDQKAAYSASQFVEGLIPLRPPSKELC